ncbi:hypothetical protein BGZ46_004116 [Entomortierella lignicola]|nr:hypothetical protein BGZ46_004116 [Entomortierella lignicola]
MAATATISTSTTIPPVVGKSTMMSLVGASSPPTTPPATPTSPILSSTKSISESDLNMDVDSTVDPPVAAQKVQRGMAATPPPSPPPAPVNTALLPVTPFPIDGDYDAPLMATLTAETVGINQNGAGHSLTEVEATTTATSTTSAATTIATVSNVDSVSSPASAVGVMSVSNLATVSISEPMNESGSETDVTSTSTNTNTTTAVPTPTGEATTFFDDMINAPQPPANILTLSPTTSIPDLYHDFFDNHPELYDSDNSSDPEMDLDLEDYPPAITRARTMADLRQTAVSTM